MLRDVAATHIILMQNRDSFPSDEALIRLFLPGAEKYQPEMGHAIAGLEGCVKPVYYSVRKPDAAALNETRLHKIPHTPQRMPLSSVSRSPL